VYYYVVTGVQASWDEWWTYDGISGIVVILLLLYHYCYYYYYNCYTTTISVDEIRSIDEIICGDEKQIILVALHRNVTVIVLLI